MPLPHTRVNGKPCMCSPVNDPVSDPLGACFSCHNRNLVMFEMPLGVQNTWQICQRSLGDCKSSTEEAAGQVR